MLERIWHGRLGWLRLILLLAVAGLIGIGLACIKDPNSKIDFFSKQIRWIIIGCILFALVNLVHYRKLGKISYLLYTGTLVLLLVILIGKYLHVLPEFIPMRNWAYRWIEIKALKLQIQPSELAKLTGILALAWYLRNKKNYRSLSGLFIPFALTLLPMFLIILEPDLGTTLLFPPVLFAMLFVAGARKRHLLTIIFLGLLMAVPAFFTILRPYQRERVESLFHQNSDDPYWINDAGYQLNQSKICIGSGQLKGHGYQQGIYVNYDYLPEKHNDFVFALIAHQWGFLGCVVVFGLYFIIILCIVEIASQQTDPFGRLIAIGIAAQIAVQMYINIGMTTGLMPVTGMTLPFVSYGGSSLLSNFLALGLVMNVARHHPRQIANRAFEFDS